jgi:cation diffusion facilitator CzcD-associated flavoprotein CzcO
MEVERGAEHFDVLIVGAGISGIGAACKLQDKCAGKTFAILEARSEMGGTWDLFRYPGIRSDSDMYTLGYGFRPWRDAKAIADGPSIKTYVIETAREAGVDRKIRFNCRVTDASWSSANARWTVTAETATGPVRFTCSFLMMCSGYYRYAEGYTPEFKGRGRFKGRIIHPQLWPEDLDYAGKRVVVIGSGATAVTLIPSLTDRAGHVVMLQRSPSYVFSMPGTSPLAKFLSAIMPKRLAYFIMRWHRIIFTQLMFKLARARPQKTRERLIQLTREALPEGYDVAKHFTPKYNPWDQRLCLVPDDDLFAAISSGKASVETDEIETFTERGILLKSGKELVADIIVTATGLALEVLGGAKLTIDGRPFKSGESFTYKGFGFSCVPNLAAVFGYTNASWTLRADLVSDYVCRLINYMDRRGYASATPVVDDPAMKPEPFLDFSSGYVRRAVDFLPKQGSGPWRHPQDYASDIVNLRYGRIEDGVMEFQTRTGQNEAAGGRVLAAAE